MTPQHIDDRDPIVQEKISIMKTLENHHETTDARQYTRLKEKENFDYFPRLFQICC